MNMKKGEGENLYPNLLSTNLVCVCVCINTECKMARQGGSNPSRLDEIFAVFSL